jgi:hypothetical protein
MQTWYVKSTVKGGNTKVRFIWSYPLAVRTSSKSDTSDTGGVFYLTIPSVAGIIRSTDRQL